MKYLLTLAAALLLAGCTTAMKSGTGIESEIESVDYKNYTLGVSGSAYVGENIIARKSYKSVARADLFSAQQDFSLTGGIATTSVNLNAKQGDVFRIAGKNELDNYVVNIPGSIFMLGIDKNGEWDKTVMSSSFWTSPIGSGNQYKMNPPHAKFTLISSNTPLSAAGYVNHEILFTGISSNGISLLYREYTFENMARSDFKQELVYPANAKEIRFRNYLIELQEVNSSEIKYVVKQD